MYGDGTHGRSVLVSSGATAHDVCHMLAQSAHCMDEESWALIEHHSVLGLGKIFSFKTVQCIIFQC